MDWTNTEKSYDAIIASCRDLMMKKNHDYGESWRFLRQTSITDLIWAKINRIRNIEDMSACGKAPLVSEGIESEFRDILNYCVFAIIKIMEKESKNE